MTKPCDICGNPFEVKRKDARYCSAECHTKRKREGRRPDKACAACGSSFAPRAARSCYCSRSCRDAGRSPKPVRLTQGELQSLWLSQRSPLRVAIEAKDHTETLRLIRARCNVTEAECWEWQGQRNQPRKSPTAYPVVNLAGARAQVHRLVLEAKHGAPLGSQQAHHACANTICVNPDHLAPATYAENMAEMKARHSYVRRIQELEAALRELAPAHPLLSTIPTAATA